MSFTSPQSLLAKHASLLVRLLQPAVAVFKGSKSSGPGAAGRHSAGFTSMTAGLASSQRATSEAPASWYPTVSMAEPAFHDSKDSHRALVRSLHTAPPHHTQGLFAYSFLVRQDARSALSEHFAAVAKHVVFLGSMSVSAFVSAALA